MTTHVKPAPRWRKRRRSLGRRLPVVLSATALVIAVFGSTPTGQAVASAVVPFAKKAGYAKNSGAVKGVKVSKAPTPGRLLPLGQDGKFPATVVPAGPKGDPGPPGPRGPSGIGGYQLAISDGIALGPGNWSTRIATCPAGKNVLGGGASSTLPGFSRIILSAPNDPGTGWVAGIRNEGSSNLTMFAWAICATVS
ncbi:MAG TPA: hypothetical protein VD704_01600 [Gaiellaceae bacterium]|nr:hypothetical protein [Gaiellaceae bacterium]